ncbi:hypothetical protein ACFFX0_08825 [Citricoccus parietis]|uniref:Uncharacterized protein n=1 Tax=Citricoccus parietis TaxID=592307 RepID=A0ABV5FYI5_9MICC
MRIGASPGLRRPGGVPGPCPGPGCGWPWPRPWRGIQRRRRTSA